jgi:very-short-patch-repair endonuclease
MYLPPELELLARNQHGLVAREQVLVAMTADGLRGATAAGLLVREQPNVYRLGGSPITYLQRALGATLASGAVASHRTAAYLWDLVPDEPRVVEVTAPYPRHPRLRVVKVHRSRDLTDDQVVVHRGIPVTNPMRALVDLAAVVRDTSVLEDALERGVTARRYSVIAVENLLARLAQPGRDGAGVLGRVLDERALGRDRADGLLEPRMARLLRNAGLPQPVFQHPVRLGRHRYRVDFAYPEELIAIEVDGYELRASPRAHRRDLERQNRLVSAGWTVLRFTWHDVVRRPTYVAAAVAEVL